MASVCSSRRSETHVVAAILTKAGAEVLEAASASEGLSRLKEQHPDVVLADIGLPGKDGYAFVRELRALELEDDGRHTPTGAVTAYARSEDRASLLAAGFDAHLAKPVEPRILVETVIGLWKRGGHPVDTVPSSA